MESLEMNKIFWKGKRVFITGHTGFKGRWLSIWLNKLGAILTGYSNFHHIYEQKYRTAELPVNMVSIIGDIQNYEKLSDSIKTAEPEIIIHMAAQAIVKNSHENPIDTYLTNVIGTVNLLEAVKNSNKIKCLVNVTSDKCYNNNNSIWPYRENDELGGDDAYSCSKACSELITSSYRKSYFIKNKNNLNAISIATARAGNVIGGGDWADHRLIPDCIKSFLEFKKVNIRYPYSIRPWQYVLEPLRGYLSLAEKLYEGDFDQHETFNFGPFLENHKNVSWVVDKIVDIWGDGTSWQIDDNHHKSESQYLRLDISKAYEYLSWKPTLDIEKALMLTTDWYKYYMQNTNLNAFTLSQIEEYEYLSGLK